jgi:hypothetical protein
MAGDEYTEAAVVASVPGQPLSSDAEAATLTRECYLISTDLLIRIDLPDYRGR